MNYTENVAELLAHVQTVDIYQVLLSDFTECLGTRIGKPQGLN